MRDGFNDLERLLRSRDPTLTRQEGSAEGMERDRRTDSLLVS